MEIKCQDCGYENFYYHDGIIYCARCNNSFTCCGNIIEFTGEIIDND